MLPPFTAIHWCSKFIYTGLGPQVSAHNPLKHLKGSWWSLMMCLMILWTYICSFMFLAILFSLKQYSASTLPIHMLKQNIFFSFLFLKISCKKKPPKRLQAGKDECKTVRHLQSFNSPTNICHGLKKTTIYQCCHNMENESCCMSPWHHMNPPREWGGSS